MKKLLNTYSVNTDTEILKSDSLFFSKCTLLIIFE